MDPAATDKRPVRVTILNQSFTLLAKGDPREVEQLAQSVDDLLYSIAKKSPNADSARVAVLGCLHLADRLRELDQSMNRFKERVERKSEEFVGLLAQVIGPDHQ